MAGIGIVGSGISGLHLALLLQQAGVRTTVYAERSPDEVRAGRLLNTVARFGPARDRERALGVEHWDLDEDGWALFGAAVTIGGPQPLAFRGRFRQPASLVDFRLYLPQLLEDYAERGGDVVVGRVTEDDLPRLAARHDLVVVAAGGRALARLFPRDAARSPYDAPQRLLLAGVFEGIAQLSPPMLTYVILPGTGELFQAPFLHEGGRGANLLLEAVPGGPLEPLVRLRYEDDPAAFDAAVLAALREHAPHLAERIDPAAFGLRSPRDLLQGAVTPTVRRAWAPIADDTYAVAVGDGWVVNDPVLGQGANLGSRSAELLAQAVLAAPRFDEQFCRDVEGTMWEAARHVTEWTNAALVPPPPHAIGLFVAAAQRQDVAEALVDGFASPEVQWSRFATPEGAARFLAEHDMALPVVEPPEQRPAAEQERQAAGLA